MKRIRLTRLTLLVLVLIIALVTVSIVSAQVLYGLPWWTMDSGGGSSQGGNYTLSGAIGQPDAAQSQGGTYHLSGGFWSGGGVREVVYMILLPITQKH
jgi:hypothetical protein